MIDELVREGARRMLAEALQAEVDDYITRHTDERDAHGQRLVCDAADGDSSAMPGLLSASRAGAGWRG